VCAVKFIKGPVDGEGTNLVEAQKFLVLSDGSNLAAVENNFHSRFTFLCNNI
jgi:hypothetical protein